MRPIFVVVEGIDRCGKTKQAWMLAQKLRSMSFAAENLETPDRSLATGKLATRILKRQVELVSTGARADAPLPHETEWVLQCVLSHNRYEVALKVNHHLYQGTSVVCARWWPSSVVYALEDGLSPSSVVAGGSFLPQPTLCALLDVDPPAVAGRLDRRQTYEVSAEVQERLASAYRRMWADRAPSGESEDWVVVDGRGSEEEVADRLWAAVSRTRPELREARRLQESDRYGRGGT
jgi:dTMP kinase